MKDYIKVILVGVFLIGLGCGGLLLSLLTPKTNLPEEYKLMKYEDNIRGYYNPDDNTLYIEFTKSKYHDIRRS